MFSEKRLQKDIQELNQDDPKYLPPEEVLKTSPMILDRISHLDHVVFLQPNDPWMMADDSLVRLPFPPVGEGLSMNVCAFPIVKALGGIFIKPAESSKWILTRGYSGNEAEQGTVVFSSAESPSEDYSELYDLTMTLSDILIPLKMGLLLMDNGGVYIGERRQLALLEPPNLDENYRLILHPFRDQELFQSNIITDEWGYQRQKYSRELAIRSLAFSKASYNMHIKPFIMDGWLDYTLIYEGKIQAKADDWNLEPSKKTQFLSFVRQLVAAQSMKAVVMGRPMSNHTAIVNITFTGTKHTADWLGNIKVSVSNQLHKGFYELATQFDSMRKEIHLAYLAKTLGLMDLTLDEVIAEAAKPDSRFKIWVTGHSQGGALTQVYIAEFLCKRGVLPENIFGYSFASPFVATAAYSENPGNYPIYNIGNTDDFAIRVGSALRLGMDLLYTPDERFREEHYKDYSDPQVRAMYRDVLKLCYWMTDSFKFGEFMIAVATFAPDYPVAKDLEEWIRETPVLRKIFKMFTNKTDLPKAIHDRMYQLLEKPYMDVGGKPPSEDRIRQITAYLKALFDKWGIDCITTVMYNAHIIPRNYAFIVQMSYDDFQRGIWTAANPACLCAGDHTPLIREVDFPEITGAQ